MLQSIATVTIRIACALILATSTAQAMDIPKSAPVSPDMVCDLVPQFCIVCQSTENVVRRRDGTILCEKHYAEAKAAERSAAVCHYAGGCLAINQQSHTPTTEAAFFFKGQKYPAHQYCVMGDRLYMIVLNGCNIIYVDCHASVGQHGA